AFLGRDAKPFASAHAARMIAALSNLPLKISVALVAAWLFLKEFRMRILKHLCDIGWGLSPCLCK
ncbi:hypothetical protein QIH23_26750, partial [Klebsiella pneumoniae]|nr:hypothetical protein [Klebsiella pneumoniae]